MPVVDRCTRHSRFRGRDLPHLDFAVCLCDRLRSGEDVSVDLLHGMSDHRRFSQSLLFAAVSLRPRDVNVGGLKRSIVFSLGLFVIF